LFDQRVQRSADVDSDGGGKQRVAWAVLVPDFHVDCGGVADGALDEDFTGTAIVSWIQLMSPILWNQTEILSVVAPFEDTGAGNQADVTVLIKTTRLRNQAGVLPMAAFDPAMNILAHPLGIGRGTCSPAQLPFASPLIQAETGSRQARRGMRRRDLSLPSAPGFGCGRTFPRG
jgi:hypothetical protein